jgi:hypothetical protein
MKKLWIAHILKRSGNHAIIGWLTSHDRSIFFNNIIPIAPILKGEKEFPPTEDFSTWLERKFRNRVHQFIVLRRKPSIIVNLENHDIEIDPFSNIPLPVTNILILRDPFNMFSSRIRKASLVDNPAYPDRNGPAMQRVVNLWKIHAKEFLGETNFLDNKVCIYFDKWYSDSKYRQEICCKLNLKFTDAGFTMVSKTGGGSSFEGTKFDGNSSRMDVLNRKKNLSVIESSLLESLFKDEEMNEIYCRLGKHFPSFPNRGRS